MRCFTSFVSNTNRRDSSNKVTIGLFVCVNVVSSFISISTLPQFFPCLLPRFTIVPAKLSSLTSSKSSFNKLINVIFFSTALTEKRTVVARNESFLSWNFKAHFRVYNSLPKQHTTIQFITVYQSNTQSSSL